MAAACEKVNCIANSVHRPRLIVAGSAAKIRSAAPFVFNHSMIVLEGHGRFQSIKLADQKPVKTSTELAWGFELRRAAEIFDASGGHYNGRF
jgi:hypothetical protein